MICWIVRDCHIVFLLRGGDTRRRSPDRPCENRICDLLFQLGRRFSEPGQAADSATFRRNCAHVLCDRPESVIHVRSACAAWVGGKRRRQAQPGPERRSYLFCDSLYSPTVLPHHPKLYTLSHTKRPSDPVVSAMYQDSR